MQRTKHSTGEKDRRQGVDLCSVRHQETSRTGDATQIVGLEFKTTSELQMKAYNPFTVY